MKTFKRLTNIIFVASSLVFGYTAKVSAQPVQQGIVIDPPSNVRSSPNGSIICAVKSTKQINIYGSSNGWYITDICGETGYIHNSQVRLKSNSSTGGASNVCSVVNIQKGQLAVRFTPGGESKAGLDNGNIVKLLNTQGIWSKVRVLEGPNRAVNGVVGWVNSDYLSCN